MIMSEVTGLNTEQSYSHDGILCGVLSFLCNRNSCFDIYIHQQKHISREQLISLVLPNIVW